MRRLHIHGAMACSNWLQADPLPAAQLPQDSQTLTRELPRRIDSGFGGAAPLPGAAGSDQQVPSALSQEN
jgi:hypothetical protein